MNGRGSTWKRRLDIKTFPPDWDSSVKNKEVMCYTLLQQVQEKNRNKELEGLAQNHTNSETYSNM